MASGDSEYLGNNVGFCFRWVRTATTAGPLQKRTQNVPKPLKICDPVRWQFNPPQPELYILTDGVVLIISLTFFYTDSKCTSGQFIAFNLEINVSTLYQKGK